MPFASRQTSLQNFLPSAGVQLQGGWAHFDVAFILISFDRLWVWFMPRMEFAVPEQWKGKHAAGIRHVLSPRCTLLFLSFRGNYLY